MSHLASFVISPLGAGKLRRMSIVYRDLAVSRDGVMEWVSAGKRPSSQDVQQRCQM